MSDIQFQVYAPEAMFVTLKKQVQAWAEARQINPNAKPHVQLMKTGSELGELMDAEIKGDRAGIIDGIGDVLVTLIIYARLHDPTLEECLHAAYVEIKDRKDAVESSLCRETAWCAGRTHRWSAYRLASRSDGESHAETISDAKDPLLTR